MQSVGKELMASIDRIAIIPPDEELGFTSQTRNLHKNQGLNFPHVGVRQMIQPAELRVSDMSTARTLSYTHILAAKWQQPGPWGDANRAYGVLRFANDESGVGVEVHVHNCSPTVVRFIGRNSIGQFFRVNENSHAASSVLMIAEALPSSDEHHKGEQFGLAYLDFIGSLVSSAVTKEKVVI